MTDLALSRLINSRHWRESRTASIATAALIYISARLITSVMMSSALDNQVELLPSQGVDGMYVFSRVPSSPGLWEGSANWDGQWYRLIAEEGYPATLPRSEGLVQQNQWAFYPLYPFIVGLLMRVLGTDFSVTAPVVSLLAGLVATLIIFLLVESSSDRFVASVVAVALNTFPTSPALQVAYTESLALLLLALAFCAFRKRRLDWFLTFSLLLSLTRPIVIPLAILMALSGVVHQDSLLDPRRRPVAFTGTMVSLGALTVLWPTVAAIATGERNAFLATQAAWPANQVEGGLWGNWLTGSLIHGKWVVAALAWTILLVFLLVALQGTSRRWGPDWRLWTAIYPAFVLLSTRPSGSLFRYLLLTGVPFWPYPSPWPRHTAIWKKGLRIALPGACFVGYLYLQWMWITHYWVITGGVLYTP